MPKFTVVPITAPEMAVDTDPDGVFTSLSALDCRDADILCDGEYTFSIQRRDGPWIITHNAARARDSQARA